MRKSTFILLFFITLLGFGIRLYKLTSSPAGLYIDETSIGYNAYSLLKTGKDEHGRSWPLFFEAFGEWKLPVYIYSVYLTQLVIGPTDISVRLPAVLFGTFSIPLIFFLTLEIVRKEKAEKIRGLTPYISSFLLAVSPWHFQFTHTGFEASSGIFFILGGLFLFLYGVHHKRFFILTVSSVCFVLTLYSYNSARIVTPIIFLLCVVLYIRSFKLWQWLMLFGLSIVIAFPVARFFISPAGLVRAQQVSIFYAHLQYPWQQFLSNYWQNISPYTLFIHGEPTIAHLTSHRMSLLYGFELPFFIIGFITILVRRSKELCIILVLLVVGFIPPAITILNPHALRASLVIPATIFISAFGMATFWSFIWASRIRNLLVGGYATLLSISVINFLTVYHQKYTPDAGGDWQVGIRLAAKEILNHSQYQNVYIDAFGAARVAFSWYLKIDPESYQHYINSNHVENYFFEVNNPRTITTRGDNLFISRKKDSTVRLIKEIDFPNGQPAYYVLGITAF